MKKKKRKKFLKILELGEKATRDDIENAYSHFVKLYSSEDSPEIHPLKEEILSEERKKILSDIDKAYKELVGEDGVNRIDFSAEIEPQEIILDEEGSAIIEHEKIDPSDMVQDEDEPVVEFVFTNEPVKEIPVDEPEVIEESVKDDPEVIDPQVIEFDMDEDIEESVKDEPEVIEESVKDDPEVIDPQVIEFDMDEIIEESVKDEPEVIEPQVIEFDMDESVVESLEEEPEISDPQLIEFDMDESVVESLEEESGEVDSEEVVVDDVEITGKYLKKIRESKKIKVRDVGEILNIPYKSIVHIENEKFEKLNDPGFLRWLIKAYTKFLGLNEEKGAEDYMKRYRNKK